MTKFLQLFGMVLAASALTAEDAKVEAKADEHKVGVAEHAKKAEDTHAVHHEHVNRKAADALSARLNAMSAPYAAPLATIPEMPACCAAKKPAANHGHAAAVHHNTHKKVDHKDVKHDEKKEHHDADTKADHKTDDHKKADKK